MSSKESRDTVSLRFAGLHDSSHLALVLIDKDQTILCEDTLLTWVDWASKSIYCDTVAPSQVLSRLSYWLFGAYLNGGKALRWYLDSNRATMRYADTTIDGNALHWLEFVNPNDDPADTMIGDQHVCYGIDDHDRLARARITNVDFHQPMVNGKELLSSEFNRIDRFEVQKEIRDIKQKAASGGFGLRKKVTKEETESKLIKVGDVVKNFGGRTPDGDSIEFASVHAKVLLLDFWYTGCGPCRYALPFLRSMQRKYGSAGFTLVGLDPMDDEPPIMRLVLKSEALTNPEILIGRDVSDKMFGISLYPTMILLDKNRKVQYVRLGYMKSYEPEIESAIQTALKATE